MNNVLKLTHTYLYNVHTDMQLTWTPARLAAYAIMEVPLWKDHTLVACLFAVTFLSFLLKMAGSIPRWFLFHGRWRFYRIP